MGGCQVLWCFEELSELIRFLEQGQLLFLWLTKYQGKVCQA